MTVPPKNRKGPERKPGFFWFLCAIALAVTAALALRGRAPRLQTAIQQTGSAADTDDTAVFARYGQSPSCKSCHEEEFQLWAKSHHALAERPLKAELDAAAFDPP